VAQLFETLCYKPEGRGFDSRWCHGVDSTSNRNTRNISWGKGGRCVGLTTLPPQCVECLKIWETQTPGTLRACQGL
jgi:hypothetical protein